MKTLCYSVRLKELRPVSEKAYLAVSFDGSSDIIPASQIFGQDLDVEKSEAYWISAWILDKKSLAYSRKKESWFDEDGRQLPTYTVERHQPEKIDPVESNIINELKS